MPETINHITRHTMMFRFKCVQYGYLGGGCRYGSVCLGSISVAGNRTLRSCSMNECKLGAHVKNNGENKNTWNPITPFTSCWPFDILRVICRNAYPDAKLADSPRFLHRPGVPRYRLTERVVKIIRVWREICIW